MTEKHFILATAGHVDHGKSALVKALTGTDPDRLPEEKARQITIDLGFAELILDGPNEQKLHIGIVDVPGHEDFVRNMIAGVGSIDLALFVVAADDGWMPQTEEHLQILTYLGVQRAVIALTKSDLGDARRITAQIRERLHDTAFARSPIIPTSVRTGEGIESLKSALASELSTMQPQRDVGKARLFIDRAFVLRGIGTVVTGTLTGGRLHRSEGVVIQPKDFDARIRSIQSHGCEVEYAQPGMRTAINIPDVGIGDGPGQIKRGDVITVADASVSLRTNLGSGATSTLVVLLEKSHRLKSRDPAARPLKNGTSVNLHHGTSRFPAKIYLLDSDALEPAKQRIAQLKPESPIFAFLGDRFVLRDASEQHTIAGGVVLDPDGDRKEFRDEEKRKLLMARATAPDDVDLCVRSEIGLRGFVAIQSVLGKSRFSRAEIAEALLRLQRLREIVVHGKIAANTGSWQALRNRAALLIDNALSKNPERIGLDLSQLRAALRDQAGHVFEALIEDMCSDDFARREAMIARRSHQPTLPAKLRPAAAKIREALSKKPFDPPARREIESDPHAQRVLRFLIESGVVIEIAPDAVLSRENFERMKNAVADFISKNGPATVSELRQALESSRRIMVPFLERLDRDGITHRTGDQRTLGGLRNLLD
jgi:selenocysteine-specific elongation factor